MNSVQMHLALTHVPVMLSLVGLVMLVVALVAQNTTLTKTAYVVLLIAGLAALPVFFSGEGTEEAVEHLPGVSEAVIERHEDVAKMAMISITAGGLLAVAALFSIKWLRAARVLKLVVLVVAIASGGLMAQTAHLGGQIRHTEISSKAVALQGNKEATANDASGGNQPLNEPDDD